MEVDEEAKIQEEQQRDMSDMAVLHRLVCLL